MLPHYINNTKGIIAFFKNNYSFFFVLWEYLLKLTILISKAIQGAGVKQQVPSRLFVLQ
jgi:hypothetical protein